MRKSPDLTRVDDQSFDQQVTGAQTPVLVDFWAPWCPSCPSMAAVLEQVAAERAGALRVVAVNVEESATTAARHRVMAVPTVMLFDAGGPIWSVVGARSKARIDAELDSALARAEPAG